MIVELIHGPLDGSVMEMEPDVDRLEISWQVTRPFLSVSIN